MFNKINIDEVSIVGNFFLLFWPSGDIADCINEKEANDVFGEWQGDELKVSVRIEHYLERKIQPDINCNFGRLHHPRRCLQ